MTGNAFFGVVVEPTLVVKAGAIKMDHPIFGKDVLEVQVNAQLKRRKRGEASKGDIARTICRLGKTAIIPLENFIESSKDKKAIAQAVDAYGHLLFSNKIDRPSSTLQKLSEKYPENALFAFKIARCLSGFHDEWATSFLLETLQKDCLGLKLEALRSLLLLEIELPEEITCCFSSEMRSLAAAVRKTGGGNVKTSQPDLPCA